MAWNLIWCSRNFQCKYYYSTFRFYLSTPVPVFGTILFDVIHDDNLFSVIFSISDRLVLGEMFMWMETNCQSCHQQGCCIWMVRVCDDCVFICGFGFYKYICIFSVCAWCFFYWKVTVPKLCAFIFKWKILGVWWPISKLFICFVLLPCLINCLVVIILNLWHTEF